MAIFSIFIKKLILKTIIRKPKTAARLFVGPPVLPSRSFFGIGSLVFSKTQHGVRVPCLAVCDRAGFLPPKWAKNRVFSNLFENLVINFF